jgi:hypothetical protein
MPTLWPPGPLVYPNWALRGFACNGNEFLLHHCTAAHSNPRYSLWDRRLFCILSVSNPRSYFPPLLGLSQEPYCSVGGDGSRDSSKHCLSYLQEVITDSKCHSCIIYIDEWFAQRKGLAYGITWSASGFGGVVLPLLLEYLLTSFGFQTTMRIWAGIMFVVSFPLAFYVKPRLPHSATMHIRPFNMRYVLSRLFALHQLANIIEATGYFLPSIYLPSCKC